MASSPTPPAPVLTLRLAALATWLAVGIPPLARLTSTSSTWVAPAAWLTFGVAFFIVVWRGEGLSRRNGRALLLVQTVTTLALAWSGRDGHNIAFLVIIASQLLALMSWHAALAWVAVQTTLLLAPEVLLRSASIGDVLVGGALAFGFQAFAVGVIRLAWNEASARLQLAAAHEQLKGAQAALAHNARLAERVRIARDLHDTLGHHLTALSLNLEVAHHVAEGRAPHVDTARQLTKQLLAELRQVVSAMRDDTASDLEAELRTLVAAVPAPVVHLDIPPGLAARVSDPERSRTVFRCVQEIVTNAVRHAEAKHLWIEIEDGDGGLHIRARDDGRGVGDVRPGHGLSGMRERIEGAGGRLSLSSAPGRGFAVAAFVPLGGSPL